MDVDDVLRAISKAPTLDHIIKEIEKLPSSILSNQIFPQSGFTRMDMLKTKMDLLILRTLTDKGFKAKASILAQEYYNKECLDGNNEIYGYDFIYRNPPKALEEIKAVYTDTKVIDWENNDKD